jgi:hypothetical protein
MMSSEITAPITYPPVEDAVEAVPEGGTTSNDIAIAFIFLFVLFIQSTIKMHLQFVRFY